MTPKPLPRGASCIIVITTTFLTDEIVILTVGCISVAMLAAATHIFRQYFRFLLLGLFPVAAALVFVWGFLIGAPPGEVHGSSPSGGIAFATVIIMRIAVVSGVFQLCFLTVSSSDLPAVLYRWGMREEGLAVCLGTLAIFPELKRRSDQVITARLARGLVSGTGPLSWLLHLPYLLRPLFTGILRASLQRAEVWQQKNLLSHMVASAADRNCGDFGGSAAWLSLSLVWCGLVLSTRFGLIALS